MQEDFVLTNTTISVSWTVILPLLHKEYLIFIMPDIDFVIPSDFCSYS